MYRKFKPLNIPDGWEQYWSKYPNGYTIMEALIDWVSQVDDMVENQNELTDTVKSFGERIDEFIEQFETELQTTVTDTLQDWQNSGFLNIVISEALQWQLTDYIATNEADKNALTTQLQQTQSDLNSRGVNILNPPEPHQSVIGDGVTDDTQALNDLISAFDNLIVPLGITIRVTDTIKLGMRRKSLQGIAPLSSSGTNVPRILYDGPLNRKKAVVLIGQNDVGAEPTIDGSGIMLSNILVDGNNKAGFGVYGTYLTNETKIDGVITENTLEYGQYYARGWYATLVNLVSRNNNGKGLAFGMPLEYQSGETANWQTPSPLELNNVPIDNIRAHNNGLHYAIDNVGTFRPENALDRRHGYGIGFGIGNGFIAQNFVSEANGGVNLYVYTASQPVKTIKNGYLENSMLNSNVANNLKTNMIIDHVGAGSNPYIIDNIFMNINSGGIHFIGNTGRKVWLKNIEQPTFLKSLDGLDNDTLYQTVLKSNVYYLAGMYNTLESLAVSVKHEMAENVRYTWEVVAPRLQGGVHKVYAKLSAGNTTQPVSSLRVSDPENTSATSSYPYGTLTNEWKLIAMAPGERSIIGFGGVGGDLNTPVDLKIVSLRTTIY